MIGHIAPEAAVGGPIAMIVDGDIISMNADTRELTVQISNKELADRASNWKPRLTSYKKGVMAKYAKLVSSASTGAVTS